jgi:hypothetical protein
LLPVTFLFVNANFSLNGVECKWATTAETNNHKFEVERSGNGALFEKIGEVNGAKNSLKTTHYSFKDFYPLKGSNYYRIKQLDLDGQFSYSKIVVALNEKNLEVTQWLIKPNPTNGIINVLPTENSGIPNKKTLKILDSNGLEVYSEELTLYNGTGCSINLQNLKSGLYILILDNEARKIVIEK